MSRGKLALWVTGLLVIFGCGGSGAPYIPDDIGTPTTFTLTGGGTQTINPGQTATFGFQVFLGDLQGRSPQPVTLTASGLPTGATPAFTPNPATPTTEGTDVTLQVTTTAAVAPGTYNFTINGNDGDTTRQSSATLVVNGPQTALTISVEGQDTQMSDENGYPYGDDDTANYVVSIEAPQGYAGDVRLEWRFVTSPGGNIDGVWHYGEDQSPNTLTFRMDGDNLRDSAECTLTRTQQPNAGFYEIEFRVVPLVTGYAAATATSDLDIRDAEQLQTKPRKGGK